MWYILFVEHEGHGERNQNSTGCTLPVYVATQKRRLGALAVNHRSYE